MKSKLNLFRLAGLLGLPILTLVSKSFADEAIRTTKSAQIVWGSCGNINFPNVAVADGYSLVVADVTFERSSGRGIPLAVRSSLLEPFCFRIRSGIQPRVILHIKNLSTSDNGGGEIVKIDVSY